MSGSAAGLPLEPAVVRTSRRTKRRLITDVAALRVPRTGDEPVVVRAVLLRTFDAAGRSLTSNLIGVSVSSSIHPQQPTKLCHKLSSARIENIGMKQGIAARIGTLPAIHVLAQLLTHYTVICNGATCFSTHSASVDPARMVCISVTHLHCIPLASSVKRTRCASMFAHATCTLQI